MQEEIRLVYFDIRGLAEPVRWMLKIAGIDFRDERIPLDAWATTKKSKSNVYSLLKRRSSVDSAVGVGLRKQFVGQLPIVTIGDDFLLTQPLAVCRFLARRCGFSGDTEMEEARAEELADLVYDLRLRALDYHGKAYKSKTPDVVVHTVFRDFASAPESKEKNIMREDFKNIYFPLYFSKFNELLNANDGDWIAGPNLTYGDFVLANFLDIAEDLVDPTCLEEFPDLRALKDKVLAIPEIVRWRKSQSQNVADAN